MFRYLVFAALIAAIGYACYDLGQRGAQAYERMLTARVSNALDVLGFSWASVRADGLRLSIYGHAPDTFARDLALELGARHCASWRVSSATRPRPWPRRSIATRCVSSSCATSAESR